MVEKLSTEAFRSVFRVVDKDFLHWFPGHMGRGLKQMQQKLRSIDCVIEVHDARIPISGRNANFKYTISGIKPHILVLNKIDLIDKKWIPRIRERLEQEYPNLIFTNCKNQNCVGVKKLFPLAQDLIKNSDRFNRTSADDSCIMMIGVPNVGKSSLINALRARHLRKGNASQVGANPGITRSVLHKIKLCENPLFYMLDTPGVLEPHVTNPEVGLKLAVCNTIKDHLVGETIIADYLLYWLNKHKHFRYVKVLQLKEATDNILEVLVQVSCREKKMLKMRNSNNELVARPDFDYAAKRMLQLFRSGAFGNLMMDEDLLL